MKRFVLVLFGTLMISVFAHTDNGKTVKIIDSESLAILFTE